MACFIFKVISKNFSREVKDLNFDFIKDGDVLVKVDYSDLNFKDALILKDGAKLKAFVFFKGRSIIFKEQGQILLLKLAQELEEYGKVEQLPVLEGKKMIMFVSPKKAKKK